MSHNKTKTKKLLYLKGCHLKFTFNIISFALMMHTKVRRVLNTVRLEFVLQVVLLKQFCDLIFMLGVVLRVTFVGKIQAVSEELVQVVHLENSFP